MDPTTQAYILMEQLNDLMEASGYFVLTIIASYALVKATKIWLFKR